MLGHVCRGEDLAASEILLAFVQDLRSFRI